MYNLSAKEEFINNAKSGKILARKCTKCGYLHLATTFFCQNCGNKGFENVSIAGNGTVVTYTIITVPPAGYEKYTPYAWVVIKLDGVDLRVSGFMQNIHSPADLPLGTKTKIAGYDERGILLEKL
ncbi:MAG TPA: OB-fold domain-containing protein [Nitrosopumilaceae archaeon]|nr:OB-fold domain-containing protein [Nitrosopumilaceae archaeon]